MVILAAVSDLHTNSTIALCPNKVNLDDGGTYTPSKLQKWINGLWADYWQLVDRLKSEHHAEVVTIINGELADNNKHGTTQLISRNPADQVKAALAVLEPVRAVSDQVIVTRGTAAHVGSSSNMDEGLAQSIATIRNKSEGTASWWKWYGVLGGVRVDAAHHPGTGSGRPWTTGGAAIRVANMVASEYVRRDMKPPDLVLRGHNHRPEDSFRNVKPTRAVITPSWQGPTDFGHRLGGALLPIGANIFGLHKGRIVLDLDFHHDIPLERWRKT